MSVAMVENWSRIQGTTQSVAPAPGYQDFSAVQVKVDQVEPVQGYPNLMGDAQGKDVAVLMPNDLVQRLGVKPGDRITARVRRAGLDRVFAHQQMVSVERAGG